MQTVTQIIAINLTILPLLSSTFIKPTGKLDDHFKYEKALNQALNDNDARKAFKNYSLAIKLYSQHFQDQALNYAATIMSAPGLSQEKKEHIAAWASKKLFRSPQVKRKYSTWERLAVDLMHRTHAIQTEQINKSCQDHLATKRDTKIQQDTIKVNIFEKIKKNEQVSIGIEDLTSCQFTLEEKTLLTEYFAIRQLQNAAPRLTIQNEFTTFNDLDELERQVYQVKLTNAKQAILGELEQQTPITQQIK